MAIETKRGVPGIPLAALDAVQDQNTQMVLRAIVDGWNVRNGSSGKGDMAFVTKSEVDTLAGTVGGLQQSFQRLAGSQAGSGINPGEISRIINDLQAQIFESQLFKELGQRIDLIDVAIVDEQNARITAVQQVANDLAAETATRLGFDNVQGSQIASLQTTTATQATQISGLTTRVSGAESTIINLQSTTAQQATSLTSLTTRVGTSESNITNLQQTTFEQAQSLSSLTTRIGSAESSISTLNTTTAQQATSLTSLTTRVANAEGAITNEATTRANADSAITTTVNTQLATVNGNLAALQTQQTSTANNVAVLTSSVSTLQASVSSNTIALQTEATVRANADNDIYGKYSVKIDNNGYVSGFGLISTSNNSTPFSEFVIRSDRFAIASPSGPGVTPKIPFIVTTSADGNGNPAGVYIDEALIKRATITTALIQDAAVDTLKIRGNAVTIPVYSEILSETAHLWHQQGTYQLLATVQLTLPENTGALVFVSCIPGDETGGNHLAYYKITVSSPTQAERIVSTSVASMPNNAGGITHTWFAKDTTPTVGIEQDYTYRFYGTQTGDVNGFFFWNRRIMVMGAKR
ncbi:Domain of unknown function DUF1983 [uncultured Caudovirales phage]|uniref:Uncharacterized protein n=1 Tax=uncultured Caudovirales phage TaxID=2100421 RepID=A0A6J5NC74_9CAUD|nr:Domain of unknown function DUF1983 [uncultured Caudovirales phage]